MSTPETLVLPGLGSPESALYQKVYRLLGEEAKRRGMPLRCLTYRGHGHLADGRIEGEVTLPGVARSIQEEVKQSPAGSILICRSFGCLLPGYLAVHHDLKLERFARIAFWGAVPYFHFWELFGTSDRLVEKNSEGRDKGVRLSAELFSSIVPLEVSSMALIGSKVVIAVGTADVHTSEAFAAFLATIVQGAGNASVTIETVEGAPHEVTEAQEESVRRRYLDALFG